MFKILKFFPALIFWGIFGYVVFQVSYPETLTQANFYQIASFFVSLFFAFALSFNIFFNKILLSLTLSLGLIFLLILKALDSLNIVTGLLTLTAIYFLVDYFRKVRKGSSKLLGLKNLTKQPKIPKLTKLR